MRTVLISGAGIAGNTLAWLLARQGCQVTVVERGQGQRSSGSPVDVRGPALVVAEQMGIVPQLREAATRVAGMRFVDRRGRVAARVDRATLQGDDIEIPRSDLAAILQRATSDHAEFLFDDAIEALDGDGGGVDVIFERAAPRRFDLVLGADGLHSGVRRLWFGPERDFVRHAGLYVATTPLSGSYDVGGDIAMFNAPRRSATIHPSRSCAIVAFIFWQAPIAELDHRDMAQHRRIVRDAYAGDGWLLPDLLDEVRDSPDVYFDAVSRVDVPCWSRGRVALLGDAATCVSLFGDGSTMAMLGAQTLAGALAEHPHDHAAAFARYEATHRALVAPRQRSMRVAASLLVPRTAIGIRTRNLAVRAGSATVWARSRATSTSA